MKKIGACFFNLNKTYFWAFCPKYHRSEWAINRLWARCGPPQCFQ